MRALWPWLLTVLLVAAPAAGQLIDDFEGAEPGEPPAEWFVPAPVAAAGFRAVVVDEKAYQGSGAVRLYRDAAAVEEGLPAGFGNLMRVVNAEPYRGKRIEYRAAVRYVAAGGAGAGDQGAARLWVRVDRGGPAAEQMGFFDNMHRRPITTAAWREYSIVGDVHDDARTINIGLMLFGGGEAYLDSVSLRIVADAEPEEAPEPPRALSPRGMENVQAFARLLGYVRFFHPSDQAASADWDELAIHGMRVVEGAQSGEELARVLGELFAPLAPTLVIAGGAEAAAARPAESPPAERAIGWVHHGVQLGSVAHGIYSSRRQMEDATAPENILPLGTVLDRQLPGGVRIMMPLTLAVDDQGRTLPVVEEAQVHAIPASRLRASADDRATRLAAVAQAWTPLQHFYPYFDVVDTDWDAALSAALAAAATDAGPAEFVQTLQRLVAELHDGHGNVFGPGDNRPYMMALAVAWIGDELAVAHVPAGEEEDGMALKPAGPERGDVILSIDGRSVQELRAEREPLISGSPQWRAWRLKADLLRRADDSPVELQLRRPDGRTATVKVRPVALGQGQEVRQPRPASPGAVAEVAPGILYCDLCGATEQQFGPRIRRLAAAEGVIFDLRGYPDSAAVTALRHLFEEGPMRSAHWNVPRSTRPDREGVTWSESRWNMAPLKPHISGKVAFLTDAAAISYAESCMGIVEHYQLGEIVGSATAGANGNVNVIDVPGGYRIAFTGMRVIKHDGSQHHIIGVLPTVPVERTIEGLAAGRDEVLQRAIEVLRRSDGVTE